MPAKRHDVKSSWGARPGGGPEAYSKWFPAGEIVVSLRVRWGDVMLARELMNTFVVEVKPTDSVQLVAELMQRESVGVVCVCDEDSLVDVEAADKVAHDAPQRRLVGVGLSGRQVAPGLTVDHQLAETPVQQVMTREPLLCRETDPMEEVEETMTKHRVGRMPVVDDEGVMKGMITLAEIWHRESPYAAAPISRSLTERELRAHTSGGHYLSSRPAKSG